MTSCKYPIPDGDIKDFVENISFDQTFENVAYASSTVSSTHYIDGKLQGTITTYTYIDMRNGMYHYSKTTLSGIYYGEGEDKFNYLEKETITYLDENGNAVGYEKTDGLVQEMKYRPEDVDLLIKNFFYTNNESNYHKGGAYYGDYIIANCGKFYDLFSLNDEKTILTFRVNSKYVDEYEKEIILMHNYNVNNLGMITSLSSKSMYKENTNTYSLTTMDCDYENEFEKKLQFK